MLKYITHRPLWLNIVFGFLFALIIFCLFILSLNWMTNHGRSSNVPSVTGKTLEEAKSILEKSGFDIEIQDSIYVDALPPSVVVKQTPDGDEVVKSNRTVYLTINRSVAPMVEMPNLVGYSFRNAEMILKNMGIRIGDTTFKPDFAKNSVLEQLYNGETVAPGTKLRMGSKVTLVLGDGIGKTEFVVPRIVGLTFGQAKALLEANGLVMGAVIASDITDTMNAYIYKQMPERYNEDHHVQHIRPGQTMDVWLQVEKPLTDSINIPLQQ